MKNNTIFFTAPGVARCSSIQGVCCDIGRTGSVFCCSFQCAAKDSCKESIVRVQCVFLCCDCGLFKAHEPEGLVEGQATSKAGL